MSKAFIINNQYGNMIFDDSLYGVYAQYGFGNAIHPWGSITSHVPNPPLSVEGIIAIKPHPNSYVSYSHNDSSNCYYLIIGHGSSYDPAFPYIQLAQPNGILPQSSDYGLQIFNSAGVKTFDSNMSYFVIRDIVTVTLAEAQTAASINQVGFTDVYKSHAYCENPYYIINNYRHAYATYFSTSSGWTIYYNTTGISSVSNTALKIGVGGGINYSYISDTSKSQLEQLIAANNASFPQYILVGEIKNP